MMIENKSKSVILSLEHGITLRAISWSILPLHIPQNFCESRISPQIVVRTTSGGLICKSSCSRHWDNCCWSAVGYFFIHSEADSTVLFDSKLFNDSMLG